jgi:hypothetical protein
MPDYDKYFTTSSMIKVFSKIKDKNLKLKAQFKGSIVDIELSIREDMESNPEYVILMVTEEDVDEDLNYKCITLNDALEKLQYFPPLLPIMVENKGNIVEVGVGNFEENMIEEKAIWLYSEND